MGARKFNVEVFGESVGPYTEQQINALQKAGKLPMRVRIKAVEKYLTDARSRRYGPSVDSNGAGEVMADAKDRPQLYAEEASRVAGWFLAIAGFLVLTTSHSASDLAVGAGLIAGGIAWAKFLAGGSVL